MDPILSWIGSDSTPIDPDKQVGLTRKAEFQGLKRMRGTGFLLNDDYMLERILGKKKKKKVPVALYLVSNIQNTWRA